MHREARRGAQKISNFLFLFLDPNVARIQQLARFNRVIFVHYCYRSRHFRRTVYQKERGLKIIKIKHTPALRYFKIKRNLFTAIVGWLNFLRNTHRETEKHW